MSRISLTGGADGNLARRADVSDGGAGADTVTVLYEKTARSYNIFTFGGADKVTTSTSNANNLNAAILGAGDDTFIGGASKDTVYDGSGNDTVTLGAGKDISCMGAGNDRLDGGSGSDFVSFGFASFDGTGATVTNPIGITCDLAIASRQDFLVFGKDIIVHFENVDGGDGADVFRGTNGDNAMYGLLGNDLLVGREGADKLNGGGGADVLAGGKGADLLTGESGADELYCGNLDNAQDVLKYFGASDSDPAGAGADIVFGFAAGGAANGDRIDLSVLDADSSTRSVDDAFIFRGTSDFRAPSGEVRIVLQGTDTVVLVDTDADAAAEMQITLKGVTGLVKADFIL